MKPLKMQIRSTTLLKLQSVTLTKTVHRRENFDRRKIHGT